MKGSATSIILTIQLYDGNLVIRVACPYYFFIDAITKSLRDDLSVYEILIPRLNCNGIWLSVTIQLFLNVCPTAFLYNL